MERFPLWIKNNRNKNGIYNVATCESIAVSGKILHVFYSNKKLSIEYEEEKSALDALKFIQDALKRGDKIVNI